MPWKIITNILVWATIDPAFRQRLQEDPLTALEAEGFELTPKEQEAFTKFHTLPFPQFCQRLQEELGPDTLP